MSTARPVTASAYVCPRCRSEVEEHDSAVVCPTCRGRFPRVAGLVDWRLQSDRYLALAAERAKAERLDTRADTTDLMGLASTYYDMTDDVVDHRRARFLRHIAGAESRGAALAACLPRRGSILELGCGTGGLLVAAAGRGMSIVGADIAARWLVVARRRLADRGVEVPLVLAQAERLPWPDGSFDTVVADSLLEHLDEPTVALREWRRVLRPGGRLLLWSPNRFSLTTDPHVGLWGVGWLPRRLVSAYLRARRRTDWYPPTLSARGAARLLEDAGFRAVQTGVPALPADWAATRTVGERALIRLYEAFRAAAPGRLILSTLGPLWELRAIRGNES